MSIFSKIKHAILDRNDNDNVKPKADIAPDPTMPGMGNAWADGAIAEHQTPPMIDVTNHLDSMPGADRLNWRTSITDLMILIGVDSDYESRKALASELGRDDYTATADDNVWLHQQVMRQLEASGGNVPPELLV